MEFINRLIYNLTEVHPLHTMVVHFPIALTGAAAFFILLALWRRNQMLEQAAFANIALAVLSTVAAAITGMRDNINIYDGAAPNGSLKMILATTLFLVSTLVTLARWRKADLFQSPGRIWYVAGYLVSFGIAAVLGFLGGVILYGF